MLQSKAEGRIKGYLYYNVQDKPKGEISQFDRLLYAAEDFDIDILGCFL